jgi:23S rRNA (adenine2503-C2)-methyltransferase
VHGVVFQGMGEPLANLDAVLAAIAVMSEPCALGIDARAITVCTAGLPAGIRRLATAAPRVRLGVSIGSARELVRREVMPIARAHPWHEVVDAVAFHARTTGAAPMWAVTLLDGVNDSDADARALAELAVRFAAEVGVRPRISIIAFNSAATTEGALPARVIRRATVEPPAANPARSAGTAGNSAGEGDAYRRSSPAREAAFRGVLADAGLASHRRYSGGSDIAAACGQLVAAS